MIQKTRNEYCLFLRFAGLTQCEQWRNVTQEQGGAKLQHVATSCGL